MELDDCIDIFALDFPIKLVVVAVAGLEYAAAFDFV